MLTGTFELRNTFEELKLLGFKGSLYRIYYELSLYSGLKSFVYPFRSQIDKKLDFISLKSWKEGSPPLFLAFDEKDDYQNILNKIEDKKQLLEDAERTARGKICCFSRWIGDYGFPINWHGNPIKKVSWPSKVHWAKALGYKEKCGDIKLTWEVNRFPSIYTLVRAYFLTKDSKWVSVFCEHLKSWEEANPYKHGVNWNSGQELAIRSVAWIYALYAFGNEPAFTETDFQRIQRLLYLHAEHINKNINFARYAVHNNHLIGEALALFAIGSLFPWFDKADSWKKRGRNILENDCLKQFYADGGYCQSSHNYHRLALHYYIWACRIGECLNERLSPKVYETMQRSGEYLASFLNENGKLPNWGANDGALLNPWTQCDYSDFRPILNAIQYLIKGRRAFEPGPWDEELFWFFGSQVLQAPLTPYKSRSTSFPVSGLHVIRLDKQNFTVLRCGSIRDRFGQADQLHVDIWWNGLNVAIDGGSYLYNDELQYHKYFMSTKSHNTVLIDEKDQMVLRRKFKWLHWTKARLKRFDSNKVLEGEHYGYERMKGKIVHGRRLKVLRKGSYLIQDKLIQKCPSNHTFTLNWLLNDFDYRILKEESREITIQFNTVKADYYLGIKTLKDAEFSFFRARHDSHYPSGWHSRYYGEKLPALSISTSYSSTADAVFTSLFTDDKTLLEEYS